VSLLFGRVWVLLTLIRLRGTGADIFYAPQAPAVAGRCGARQHQTGLPAPAKKRRDRHGFFRHDNTRNAGWGEKPQGPARAAGALGYNGSTHPSEGVGHPKKQKQIPRQANSTPARDDSQNEDDRGILRLRIPTEIARTRFPEAKGSGRCAQNDNGGVRNGFGAQARVPVPGCRARDTKNPRAPQPLLLWRLPSRRSRAPWATTAGPTPQKGWGTRKNKSRFLVKQIPHPLGMTAKTKTTEGFLDFALDLVDPAKAHPVGDFRRKKEIVRTRFPEAKGSGRCAQNDNGGVRMDSAHRQGCLYQGAELETRKIPGPHNFSCCGVCLRAGRGRPGLQIGRPKGRRYKDSPAVEMPAGSRRYENAQTELALTVRIFGRWGKGGRSRRPAK
jgi:hypothetical protein